VLRSGVRKNPDGAIFNRNNGASTIFLGLVVDVCYSDESRKSKRDISLWLEYSDLQVLLLNIFIDCVGEIRNCGKN
jgi:hypothetical protein